MAVGVAGLTENSTGTTVGVAIKTTDGGKSWQLLSLPPDVGGLGAIACASGSACLVGGQRSDGTALMLATTDGGDTWTTQNISSNAAGFAGVTCIESTFCWAFGSDNVGRGMIVATTDGGVNWNVQLETNATEGFSGVSCASSTQCWVAGDAPATDGPIGVIYGTDDGGASWKQQWSANAGSPSVLNDIACTAAGTCVAGGAVDLTPGPPGSGVSLGDYTGMSVSTTDGGVTWHEAELTGVANEVDAVECTTATNCTATARVNQASGSALLSTGDGGATWTSTGQLAVAKAWMRGLACDPDGVCVSVGEVGPGQVYNDIGVVYSDISS